MTSSAASDRMGGKQEPTQANQTGKAAAQMATQEQLRLARITQEANKDEDQAIIQKAIRKVIEATRCSQSAAEIALYDADNDVGTAIMAVLDQPPTDDWHEQKSRKAKKQSSDNHDDEENRDSQRTDRRHGRSGSSAATRNGNDAPRFRSRGGGGNKVGGGGRGGREFDGGDGDFQQHQGNRRDDDRGISRGRGGRGGGQERGRGRGRGRFGDKPGGGGAPSMGAIGTWDGGAGNSTNNQHPANEAFTGAASAWDNSMAKQNNEKDMVWQNSMAGGHKRDGATLNGGDEWSGGNDDTLNGEDTDWKNVGTLVFQRKEETEVASTAPSFASVARLPKPSEQPPPVSTQPPQPQRTPSVGDSHSITGSATPQQQQQSAYGVRNNNAIVTSLLNQQPTSETFRAPVAASPPRNPGNATSWTQQLKNDLGIGRAPVSAAAASHVGGARQSTVEFVSDDGRDDSSALPEYQFGFHVEPTVTPQQQQQQQPQQQHDYSGSNSVEAVLFPNRTSKSDAVLDNVRGPTNYSQPSTAVNGSNSKEAAKISSTSIQSSYGSMQMPSVTTVTSAMKGMSMGQSSTASMAPALAYAETTTMSYPDATRNAYAINQQFMSPAATSAYAPSSNKTVTTAASKAPVANPMFNSSMQQMYNPTFPYMNLYSPVTTVRPDDPQQYAAAALLQQYPFMPQMDLSSMLPPVVPSGAQQQSRNDQTNNYADVLGDYNKSYTGGRGDTVTSVASNVAPPPGFSGPPSNVAAAAAAQAAFGIPQGNFTSLFQSPMLPPTYHHQMPLSFMLPNMAGNGQNPVNLQQKLTQPQMFTQSTFDDQNQSSQQQDYGRSAQTGAIQSFNQQQQQQQQANKTGSAGYGGSANESKSVYGGGSHGQLSKGTFERSNYTTTATATPPPNQMSGLSQYAPPVAFNPSAHMTGFATNAGYGNAQLQQLSPMAMPGAHMHDARSSGQQSGVKHGGGMQQSKYPGQTGSYGGGWA